MLKCHVFHCDVPAKAIASALHGLCAQVRARGGAGNVGMELGVKLLGWLTPSPSPGPYADHIVLDLVRTSWDQW